MAKPEVDGGADRRIQLTVRDRTMMAWAGRQRFVTPEVIAARTWPTGRFGGGGRIDAQGKLDPRVVRNRLLRLRTAGLMSSRRYFYEGSSAWTVTAMGLSEAGVDLPPSSVDIRTYDHDLRLALLWIDLEAEFPAGRLLSEREIRSLDGGVEDPTYCPGTLGATGGARKIHYPDLAVEPTPGAEPVAIELELTPKSASRLEAILRLYKRAHHLSGVRYYIDDRLTENAVRRAAKAVEVNEHREVLSIRRAGQAELI